MVKYIFIPARILIIVAAALSVSKLLHAERDLAYNKPNIIWLNCEDLSPMLGAYGDKFADTPNLDEMASKGILYRNAYATAPICAPSRSCMITGVYATSLGTQHLRSEIERPSFVHTVPDYLRQAGYFTSNYAKTDYNFNASGLFEYKAKDLAPWRTREPGDDRPFFSFFVFGLTHEGSGNSYERYLESVSEVPKSRLHDPEGEKGVKRKTLTLT